MALLQIIEEFLIACRAAGLSRDTIQWYSMRLHRFADFAGDDWAKPRTIRSFLASLQDCKTRYQHHPTRPEEEGPISPETIFGYYRALRRFFNFLLEEGIIQENPMSRIKPPKRPKHAPKAIELEDLRKLVQAARESSPRDLAVILFMADTGARIGEVCNLRLEDIDLHNRIALLRGKGDRERLVPFSEQTAWAIKMYQAVRPDYPTDQLFLGQRGPLTTQGIYGIFRRLKRKAGIEGRCNPHSLRHGFAKRWLMNGGDLASLSDILGHQDIQTTKIYSVFKVIELREKHNHFSPIRDIESDKEIPRN